MQVRWWFASVLIMFSDGVAATPPSMSGWDYYRLGDFSMAARMFEREAARGDAGALYGLAATWHWRRPGEDLEKARQLYEQVLAQAPESDWAAWSALALARMKATMPPGKEPPVTEILAAYQRVVDRYPWHNAGEEAFLFIQATRLSQVETDAAAVVQELERFLKERPQSKYRSTAFGLLAYANEILGRPEQQLAALLAQLEALETDPLNPTRDVSGLYWQIAAVACFEVGDLRLAREIYQKFIHEYPTDSRVFFAKQQLKRIDELEARLRRERLTAQRSTQE
ncbi:MAG: tetratricopeptide repeat protein [Verrucomicrobiae bacterium]|nr:tetratricopeptide repeat protein [Verrucomicrobiae bacterium]MDW8344603.1 tetratricopeptide repeat protein [Verrucomicrobiae bacterium]